ncbi:hypothetical protein V502_02015 [Pseudogymnoascus sp. VKM F-4520 (FW-2644)]|nr:hypothetical protein V502_02015 [Pseudogymnoascus sp. VKM F-4520 (FW-2644)]
MAGAITKDKSAIGRNKTGQFSGVGKFANQTSRVAAKGLDTATKRHKELEENVQRLKDKLEEVNVLGADQEEVRKAQLDVTAANTLLANYSANLNAGMNVVPEPPTTIVNNADKTEEMDDIKEEPVEESPRSLFVPDGAGVTNQNGTSRSKTPDPDRGTPDFGRWTPEEEDKYNIENSGFTPVQARETAGLETGGKIVAWAQHNNSKPVIVAYGPRNSRKYKRSTAYRESDFLDESKTKKFGPGHRFGDDKVDGKLIRKSHEFVSILGVAFNCPVEELKPKAPKKKGEDTVRSPRVDIWVKWEINGKVEDSWEVRSSIKHLFRSFCDLYIYEAAVHFEGQYNAHIDGKRTAEDRSPTPVPRTPAVAMQIKGENQDVDLTAPQIQITNEQGAVKKVSSTTLSPIKQYREEWCDLEDIDPKKMTKEDGVNFKLAWDMVNLKLNA